MKSRLALWGQTGMFSLYHRGNLKSSRKAASGVQQRSNGAQQDRIGSKYMANHKKMADTESCLPEEVEWRLSGNSLESKESEGEACPSLELARRVDG
jgi:hypothetical protein